ncbi:MAG: hypothetical protein COV66_01800 [Nitrospinae bacterium CG11_big_fil_rev_8_21_14_0_20_45_15]|nr:MAG: hypothetical protein COV66_01800 [Nitrospinae bacterium CG11_big_fil_rev_8_21_14_0_20_45_15]
MPPCKSLPNTTAPQVINFAPGEFRPLFVASKDIERVVLGYSAKSAANDRCAKRGPKFYMVGGRPYYRISDLENYFGARPVETFEGAS